ncbi:hypothetical protein A9Q86_05520 [Flavobacteriales bacterium 33_180_T64]|nr:hypothetical protein A9Q86_05520 [Flavobacteriales bacterium 33_180_T64]
MNENADKQLDDLARKVIGRSTVESPSFDFTQTIMTQIKQLKTSKITTYVPLISKRIWGVLALAMTAVFAYFIFGTSTTDSGWFTNLGLERFSNFEFEIPLANLGLSQIMIYAIVLFAVMLCVQIPILKRYFDKRFEA